MVCPTLNMDQRKQRNYLSCLRRSERRLLVSGTIETVIGKIISSDFLQRLTIKILVRVVLVLHSMDSPSVWKDCHVTAQLCVLVSSSSADNLAFLPGHSSLTKDFSFLVTLSKALNISPSTFLLSLATFMLVNLRHMFHLSLSISKPAQASHVAPRVDLTFVCQESWFLLMHHDGLNVWCDCKSSAPAPLCSWLEDIACGEKKISWDRQRVRAKAGQR